MEELRLGISILALTVSVAAVLVNYISAKRRDIAAIRPVLVFEYQQSGWRVHNVGGGPGMDVIFTRLTGGEVHDETRLPALAKEADFRLLFCKHDNLHSFAVTYRDVEGRPYSSRSKHDLSSAEPGFRVPRPNQVEITRWWERAESDE